jgi:hypothetical protein
VIPFGTTNTAATWVNQRYQSVATDADLGSPAAPLTICNLAYANCGTQVRFFSSLQITMAQLPGGVLGSSFSGNLVNNVKVVLNEQNYIWNCTANTWSDIGLTAPYTYIPGQGDLVVEIIAIGNHLQSGSGSGFHRDVRPRAYATTWTGTPPDTATLGNAALIMRLSSGLAGITSHGTGCGGPMSLNVASGSAQLGATLGLDITNATAGTGGPFFVCIGVTLGNLNLGFVQAPNCTLYPNPFVCIPATGSPPGVSISVPNNPALICGILFAQGVALGSPATPPFGVETSNYLRIGVGN